ncbi:MAG: phospholipase D-like domain-containing protein [Bacteroidota bacterium]
MKQSILRSGSVAISSNAAGLVCSGPEFFEVLEREINAAEKEIHFQSYILKWDATGQRIIAALQKASVKGVRISLLLDAYGSHELEEDILRKELGPKVELRFFGPFFSNGKLHIGRRLHHKVAVFDSRVAVVGGINISDAYRGDLNNPPWLDFAVRIEGVAAEGLKRHCERIWHGRIHELRNRKKNAWSKSLSKANARIRPVRNDFLRNRHEVAATYRRALRTAGKHIDLVSGYFLPGRRIRMLIKMAARRGVRIRIVISEKSDVAVARLAREYLYAWLIRNGIEIYEYLPSNVHGKVLAGDGNFTSIGSYDLNNLSTYSNIELNINILDEAFNQKFTEVFEKTIKNDCTRVTAETLRKRGGLYRKTKCWLAYRVTKTLFFISYLMAGEAENG